jgi:hypothetical protein
MLAIRLVAPELMVEFRTAAIEPLARHVSRCGLFFVLAVWLCCIIFVAMALTRAR